MTLIKVVRLVSLNRLEKGLHTLLVNSRCRLVFGKLKLTLKKYVSNT